MTAVTKCDEKVNVHPCMQSLASYPGSFSRAERGNEPGDEAMQSMRRSSCLTVGTRQRGMQRHCITVCKLVLCSMFFTFGVYQMCEVEVLTEAHSGVGFETQPCQSALQTCDTVLCDTIQVDQVSNTFRKD